MPKAQKSFQNIIDELRGFYASPTAKIIDPLGDDLA